jgi:hypothetical protein
MRFNMRRDSHQLLEQKDVAITNNHSIVSHPKNGVGCALKSQLQEVRIPGHNLVPAQDPWRYAPVTDGRVGASGFGARRQYKRQHVMLCRFCGKLVFWKISDLNSVLF